MAFFRMPRFIRRFIRRKMHPMSEKHAYTVREKLAMLYAIVAWNAGGYVLYQIFVKGNKHWPTTAGLTTPEEDNIRPAVWYAEKLGIDNASVIRVSGLNVRKNEIRNGMVVGGKPVEAEPVE